MDARQKQDSLRKNAQEVIASLDTSRTKTRADDTRAGEGFLQPPEVNVHGGGSEEEDTESLTPKFGETFSNKY